MKPAVGRFAPTPSGFAHVGNLFCYLLAWLSAKQQGGSIVLRIEDLDTQRTSDALALQTMDDLLWLGLRWDQGPAPGEAGGEFYQSRRTHVYDAYFQKLVQQGLIYPCYCSRTDVKMASAPHLSDGRTVYPGTCRTLTPAQRSSQTRAPAWRIQVPQKNISFADGLQGIYTQNLQAECGDFPLRRADGVYCYHLAVTVDDALMGVTEVVRAKDLLSCTPQQIYLYEALGFPAPKFIHIPTVLDANGNRLAKRDSSISLQDLRKCYTREQIVGKLAYLADLQDTDTPQTLDNLLSVFSWDKVPAADIRMPAQLF